MIDRQRGQIAFECTYCAEVLSTGTSELENAMQEFRDKGWTCRKIGPGAWGHACSEHEIDLIHHSWKRVEPGNTVRAKR